MSIHTIRSPTACASARRPATSTPWAIHRWQTSDQFTVEIAACVPVALEVLVGPASAAELDQDWQAVWSHLRWLPLGEHELQRALDLLRELAATTVGAHHRRPIDYIVAACAEAAGGDGDLWHWDRDLTAICEHAGIAHEPEHDRAKATGINAEPGRRGHSR